MFVDITSVEHNEKKNTVTIEGTDLDSVLLNSWKSEIESPVQFKFDLTQPGPRVYLYKVIKSNVKSFNTLEDGLMALTGKMINLSSNFRAKG